MNQELKEGQQQELVFAGPLNFEIVTCIGY